MGPSLELSAPIQCITAVQFGSRRLSSEAPFEFARVSPFFLSNHSFALQQVSAAHSDHNELNSDRSDLNR